MIAAFWDKLEKKQRYVLSFGAAFVLLTLIFEFALVPFWDAKEQIKKSIMSNTKTLEEMIHLDAQFAVQEAEIAGIKRVLAARSADFTLFAWLEKKATQANIKGGIKQMNSVRGEQSASFEETIIDMKLEKITLRQLTDFLYYVESPVEMVRIKKIIVSKMKESPEYLSAGLLIASYMPASSPSGGQ